MASPPPFAYDQQAKEAVPCNRCGVDDTTVVAERDRYGLPVRIVRCVRCGLQYQNPRMTAEAYQDFYAHTYRPLVAWLERRPAQFGEQWEYAAGVTNIVADLLPGSGTLLDVGGSTGVVGRVFRARWGYDVTVIDPCADELAQATGCHTILGSAETVTFPQADVALLCRTVDHLLDPKGVLARLRASCGWLVVDAMDAMQWPAADRYKVDHPYAFTAATLKALVTDTGWTVRRTWQRRHGWYVGFVCS